MESRSQINKSQLLVLYPRYILGNGGVTITLRAFIQELKEFFDEIVVFHKDGFVRESPNYHQNFHKHNWFVLQCIRINLIRKADFVLIVSGFRPQNTFNILIAILMRKLFIVQPHGAFNEKLFHRRSVLKKWFSRLEGYLVSKAALIHYLNLREKNESRFHHFSTKSIVCPIGVQLYDKILWTGGENYFVWYGRFDIYVKGLDLLLTSWAKMQPGSRPKLILAGRDSKNGGGISKVREMISQLNLRDSVELRGPLETLEDKLDLVLSSKGLIFPSRIDADSQVVAENLSWGVPMLISKHLQNDSEQTSDYPFIFCDFSNSIEIYSSILKIEKDAKLISRNSFNFSHLYLSRKQNARFFAECILQD